MLLAVAQDPIACPELLKLAQNELNHLLDLLVGIFDDAVIRYTHQARGKSLHILPTLHFTQASSV
jgi:hypothetical protein